MTTIYGSYYNMFRSKETDHLHVIDVSKITKKRQSLLSNFGCTSFIGNSGYTPLLGNFGYMSFLGNSGYMSCLSNFGYASSQ